MGTLFKSLLVPAVWLVFSAGGPGREGGAAALAAPAEDAPAAKPEAPAPAKAAAKEGGSKEAAKEGGSKEAAKEGGSKEAAAKEAVPREAADPSVGGRKADARSTGSIQGRVVLAGKPPEPKPLKVPPDHKDRTACGEEIPDEKVILGPGNTLANTVVYLDKVPEAPKPEKRVIALDNSHCRFVPHVQATTAGSTLRISNHDSNVLHSAMAVVNASFNVSVAEQPVEKLLPKPGWVPIMCAVHSWMQAHIWVFSHDYFAVTRKEGKFLLEGIPPGKYQLKFWHEPPIEGAAREVTVEAGKTAKVDVELKPYSG